MPKVKTPLWEKLTGFIGLGLIILMLGYLAWSAFSISDSPPLIEFEVIEIRQAPENYLVRVVVRNRGDQVAMSLNVSANLNMPGEHTEQSGATVDYLPAGSDHELGFYFQNNPANGELSFRALNFQVP